MPGSTPNTMPETFRKPSAFDRRVYAALASVPRGRVTTYARLAQAIGCGSPRAVGQALRRNPYAPRIPCHRVIASDLTPGGFQGKHQGLQSTAKLRLLAAEGVAFRAGRLADTERLCSPRHTGK